MVATPETHGKPHPRATTAACDVMPPFCVKKPFEACIPDTSSAEVSTRHKMTPSFGFAFFIAKTSSEENATRPTAAPGLAAKPVEIFASSYSSSVSLNAGWINWFK